MEPSGFNPRGSIGIPAGAQQGLSDARKRAQQNATENSFKTPAEVAGVSMDDMAGKPKADAKALTEDEKFKADSEARLIQFKADLEKTLECTFSEEDLANYILKGEVSKEVVIIPGSLKGVFRTLHTRDGQDVDQEIKILIDSNKFTANGIENEKSIRTLSRVWVGIRHKLKSASWTGEAKPLGPDEPKRQEILRGMAAGTIEAAANAWVNFNALLKITLSDGDSLKK